MTAACHNKNGIKLIIINSIIVVSYYQQRAKRRYRICRELVTIFLYHYLIQEAQGFSNCSSETKDVSKSFLTAHCKILQYCLCLYNDSIG